MKIALSFGLMVLLLYLAICVLLYMKQEQAIFYPELLGRQLENNPEDIGLPYENVRVQTEDGIKLHGWYIPASDARVTLLFCHGNAGNIAHRLESIALFNALGLNVLIFDYRGYGQSTGKVSEQGLYEDAHAMWQELTEKRGITPEHIVVFGRSLGAAVASQLGTRVKPAAVILESAFASVPDMAAQLYPFLPVRLLVRYQLDNVRHVQQLQSPLLVIHSEEDEIIPYAQGEQIYDRAHEPKTFLPIQGGHNDGFIVSRRFYTRAIEAFLIKHVPGYEPLN